MGYNYLFMPRVFTNLVHSDAFRSVSRWVWSQMHFIRYKYKYENFVLSKTNILSIFLFKYSAYTSNQIEKPGSDKHVSNKL